MASPGQPHAEPCTLDAPLPGLVVGVHRSRILGGPIRHAWAFPLDLFANRVAYGAGLPLLWLVLSWFLLPHGTVEWSELVPGALVVGIGVAGISLFNTLVLFPWLVEREETYGVLGIAAGLLFG